MTQLFSSGQRTRTASRRYNEPIYSFVDASAWPSVERVRQFWESWFSQYDAAKKPGLAARFQSYDDHPHLSSLLELFTFACLRRAGLEVEIEPSVGKWALEFLASTHDNGLRFYAECTATGQKAADAGTDAREAGVLEAIDKVPTGPFLLQVEFEQRGSQAPSVRRLSAGLTAWLAGSLR